MNTNILFTKDLYRFLKNESYTHIQLRGIYGHYEQLNKSDKPDDYVLVPRKENIDTKFEESNLQIEEINSTEVKEMLMGSSGINFFVELPEKIANRYLSLK